MASLFLNHIPFGTKNRELRKKVGRAIRKVCGPAATDSLPRFHVETWDTHSVCRGRISIGSALVAKQLLDHFKRHPLRVVGGAIHPQWDRNRNAERLKYLTDPVPQLVPVSDYDSDPDHFSRSDQFTFTRLSCGVWRADGAYAEAWAFQARKSGYTSDDGPVVRIEHDNANLHIDLDHRTVRISLYHIEGFLLDDRAPGRCYVTLRALPTFLENKSLQVTDTAAVEGMRGVTSYDPTRNINAQLHRVAALSKEHEIVAPFCWVYTIEGWHPSQCSTFFKRNRNRLGELLRMRPSRNTGPRPFVPRQLKRLIEWFSSLEFPLAFQLEALLYNRFILPEEIWQLEPDIELLSNKHGQKAVADAIKRLCPWIPYRDATEGLDISVRCDVAEIKKRLHRRLRASKSLRLITRKDKAPIEIHSITVTPAGIYYDGVSSRCRIVDRYLSSN
ncbi:hypothetical protein OC845_006735 [Tilletia horrida]|nr:hypothetical protein OC845_006735 [Tilletia horrida]